LKTERCPEAVVDAEWLLRKVQIADVCAAVTGASATLERTPVVPVAAGGEDS
jgi:hypothetical protein